MTVSVLEGHVLDVLRSLPANTFQCVATSPPYYGLRDYGLPPQVWGGDPEHAHEWGSPLRSSWTNNTGGESAAGREWDLGKHGPAHQRPREAGKFCACGAWLGSLGLEPTPELFVEHLTSVFREVRRVLRPDGVCWVNLGSSYFGSGKGPTGWNGLGNQAERQGFVGGDDAHPNPTRRPRRAPAYGSDGKAPTGSMGLGSACSDLCGECRAVLSNRIAGRPPHHPAGASLRATKDRDSEPGDYARATSADAPLAAQVSTNLESSQRPRVECSHCANCGACLSVLASSSRDAQACVRRSAYSYGIESPLDSSFDRRLDRDGSGLAHLYSTIASLNWKPKDMLPMPWLVALALVADGWYLRADIIWSKPNPMPESVTDRPTKAHEYVFLLSKQRTYFYDALAVRESAEYGRREIRGGNMYGRVRDGDPRDNRPNEPRSVGGLDEPEAGRNKRSVWEIATAPFPSAHFATFPPKLVEPMLLAGSRPGDHVLDPFGGAGTTGLVADRLGRDCTLIELNPAYASMARERITGDNPMFAEVVA